MHDFHLALIRLTAVLLFIYTVVYANLLEPTGETIIYLCGETNILEKDVQKAVEVSNQVDFESGYHPKSYDGNLIYTNPKFTVMLPILLNGETYCAKKVYQYFIVNELLGDTVDVIERTPNGDKLCKKMAHRPLSSADLTSSPTQSNNLESTHTPSTPNGFKCVSEFFSDVIIRNSINLAKIKGREPNSGYSTAYPISDCLNCLLSPIHTWNNIDVSANNGNRRTFILTDQKYKLKEVVYKANDGAFHLCKRTANTAKGQLSTSFRWDFQCGTIFFGHDYLVSEVSKLLSAKVKRIKSPYPKLERNFLSHTDVLLWHIHTNGEPNLLRRSKKWLLVMNTNYQIICVGAMKPKPDCCPKKLVEAGSSEDERDFICYGKHTFPFTRMDEARKDACDKKFKTDRRFPAAYSGPGFDVPGPYLTWPLHINEHFRFGKNYKYPGKYRIVINDHCRIAGVLMRNMYSQLFKCIRPDGTTPGGFSTEKISETPR